MPWSNYFYNYGGSTELDPLPGLEGDQQSIVLENFNGQLDLTNQLGTNYGTLDNNPNNTNVYDSLGGPSIILMTFDIVVGLTLADL